MPSLSVLERGFTGEYIFKANMSRSEYSYFVQIRLGLRALDKLLSMLLDAKGLDP